MIGRVLAVSDIPKCKALPVPVDGEVVGAVSASFNTAEHDARFAQPALAVLDP